VARRIADRYTQVHLDGPGIIALQVEAHDRWRASLNEYLVKVGSSRSPVTGEWPTG